MFTLTDAAKRLIEGVPSAYQRLVVTGGTPADTRIRLEGLSPEQLLTGPATSREDAEAMLAGLWLWHDGLDESHEISQKLHSATGSFWHAIMHRREGDFSNAKYWYARCRNHPALAEIGRRVAQLAPELQAHGDPAVGRLTRAAWDPDAFVDLVARAHRDPGNSTFHDTLVRLQRVEWHALFEHCAGAAAGA